MTEKQLRNSGLCDNAINGILLRAKENKARFGTDIETSIRITYNALTR